MDEKTIVREDINPNVKALFFDSTYFVTTAVLAVPIIAYRISINILANINIINGYRKIEAI